MGQQFNFVKILESKKIFGPGKFPIQINTKRILVQNILGQNNFGQKNFGFEKFGLKKFLVKNFWIPKNFGAKQIMGPYNCTGCPKIKETLLIRSFLSSKNL